MWVVINVFLILEIPKKGNQMRKSIKILALFLLLFACDDEVADYNVNDVELHETDDGKSIDAKTDNDHFSIKEENILQDEQFPLPDSFQFDYTPELATKNHRQDYDLSPIENQLLQLSPRSRATEYKYPTELRIEIEMNGDAPGLFDRFCSLRKSSSKKVDVKVEFERVQGTSNRYVGTAPEEELANLWDIIEDDGYRTYWNYIYFVNKGGSAALNIALIEVFLKYDNLGGSHPTKEVKIARDTNKTLGARYASLRLDARRGRFDFVNKYLSAKEPGWTYRSWSKINPSVRKMIDDLGKSGTDLTDSITAFIPSTGKNVPNYKYGQAGCTETISWYYADSQHELTDSEDPQRHYNFAYTDISAGPCRAEDDLGCVEQMVKIFKNADRLYCYNLGYQKFIKVDRYGNWDLSDEYAGSSENLTSFEGDYLARVGCAPDDSKHSMMILTWNKNTKIAHTMDGPYPVMVREVNVQAKESHPTKPCDYCIGKLRD
jgi:hypothetical protein